MESSGLAMGMSNMRGGWSSGGISSLVVCPRNGFTHRCPWPTGPRPAILLVPIEGCPWSLRNLNRKIVSGT